MKTSVTTFINRHRSMITIMLIVLVAFFGANLVVKERLEDLTNTIKLQISEQETLLATIAETTARSGADEVTESVVKDCNVNERTDFDTLLGQLDKGLSNAELTKLERLFGRCGGFYSERKAVMVARLERELEVYKAHIAQLETIADKSTVEAYNVEGWSNLVAEEKKQSELFTQLVGQQDMIIKTLMSGKNPASPEIQTILNEVKQAQELLIVANRQAAEQRSELVPL